MKKIIAAALCLVSILTMASCGKGDMSVEKPDVDFDFDEFYEENKGDDVPDDLEGDDTGDNDDPTGSSADESVQLEEDDLCTATPSDTAGYTVFDTQYFKYEMPNSWANASRNKGLLYQAIIPEDSNGLITFMVTKSTFTDESITQFYEELIGEDLEEGVQVKLYDGKVGSEDAKILEYYSRPCYSTKAFFFEVNGQKIYMFFATEVADESVEGIDFSKIESQMEHILATFETK